MFLSNPMNPRSLEPKILGPIILEAAENLINYDPDAWDGTYFTCSLLQRAAEARGMKIDDRKALTQLYWHELFEGTDAAGDRETVEDRIEAFPPSTLDKRAFETRLLMLAFFHTLVESGDIHQFNTP